MKLLVTGAGGFVGSRVVQQALLAGHTVTGVIRSKAKAPPIESLGATPFVGDLEQPEALAEQAKKADAVVRRICIALHASLAEQTSPELAALTLLASSTECL